MQKFMYIYKIEISKISIYSHEKNSNTIYHYFFINSPNSYYAKRDKSDDSWELTNHFFGEYIGFVN